MISPRQLATGTAAELGYSDRFMQHYVTGLAEKMTERPFLYDTESGQLTDAGARYVRHTVLTRHTDGLLRGYEADWLTVNTPDV